jgi:hypothetical protein
MSDKNRIRELVADAYGKTNLINALVEWDDDQAPGLPNHSSEENEDDCGDVPQKERVSFTPSGPRKKFCSNDGHGTMLWT